MIELLQEACAVCLSKVNLLDVECEPTDEQLAELMRAVIEEVRVKASIANQALANTIAEEVAKAKSRYGLK